MLNHFSLIGRVPVVPNCEPQFQMLVDLLEPQEDELVQIRDGVLYVFMDSESVPYCFIEPARKAFFDFCSLCSTEAALFQSDQGVLLVGPTEKARQEKYDMYLSHLRSKPADGVVSMPGVFIPAGTPTVSLIALAQ